VSAGKLRFLAETLQMVAARGSITFASSAELQALHDMGTITVSGSTVTVDGHVGSLSTYAPGEQMVDFEDYLSLDLVFECDLDAELAGI
jgi:hypothetical protein